MDREKSPMKTIASAGAATAVCGIVLYAVGQTLKFLFRDVDPDRIEKNPPEKPTAEEIEGTNEDAEADQE